MINHLHVETTIYYRLVNKMKKKETHRYRQKTSGYQWGEGQDGLKGKNHYV